MRWLPGRVDDEARTLRFQEVPNTLPVPNIEREVPVTRQPGSQFLDSGRVVPCSPKNWRRMSLSTPRISQPASLSRRTHSEPIKPSGTGDKGLHLVLG